MCKGDKLRFAEAGLLAIGKDSTCKRKVASSKHKVRF